MNGHQPGYRFYPTEEELVSFYLQNKLDNKKTCEIKRVIPVVNIYNYDPWQLPDVAGEIAKEVSTKDAEQWFFFSPIQERESHGGRTNRTAPSGFWKATGTPSHVFSSQNRVIGEKKTLVFYKGKAPRGTKTQWKMNQYKAIDNRPSENLAPETSSSDVGPKLRHEFSLCRVYVKSGCLRSFDRRPLVGESSDTSKQLDLQKRKEVSNSDAPMKEFEEKKLKVDRVFSSEDSNPSTTPSDDAMDLGPIEDLETLWGFTNWV